MELRHCHKGPKGLHQWDFHVLGEKCPEIQIKKNSNDFLKGGTNHNQALISFWWLYALTHTKKMGDTRKH